MGWGGGWEFGQEVAAGRRQVDRLRGVEEEGQRVWLEHLGLGWQCSWGQGQVGREGELGLARLGLAAWKVAAVCPVVGGLRPRRKGSGSG